MGTRPFSLLDAYYELRESGSSSDFPNILGNLMARRLVDWAQSAPQAWRQYAAIGEVPDFRPQTRIIGYEAEDLLPIGEEGIYQDSKLADASYQLMVGTYGRAFSINRTVVINDDLGYIKQQPQRFGRSAGKSIARFVAQTLLEGNANTFDGNQLFSAGHSNYFNGAGAGVLNRANIQIGLTFLATQTVLGTFMNIEGKQLLVPPALQWTAKELINSTIIVLAGTAGTVTERGAENTIKNALSIVIDPMLSSSAAWYILGDKDEAPVIDVAFLRGKQTPDLLVEKPTMTQVAGGDDPWEYEYDVMRYKVRYDYGGAVSRWWGGAKFSGS